MKANIHPLLFNVAAGLTSLVENIDTLRRADIKANSAMDYFMRITSEKERNLIVALYKANKIYNLGNFNDHKYLNYAASTVEGFKEYVKANDYFFCLTTAFSETYRSLKLEKNTAFSVIDFLLVNSDNYGKWNSFAVFKNDYFRNAPATNFVDKGYIKCRDINNVECLKALPEIEEYYGKLGRVWLVLVLKTMAMRTRRLKRASFITYEGTKSTDFLTGPKTSLNYVNPVVTNYLQKLIEILFNRDLLELN